MSADLPDCVAYGPAPPSRLDLTLDNLFDWGRPDTTAAYWRARLGPMLPDGVYELLAATAAVSIKNPSERYSDRK